MPIMSFMHSEATFVCKSPPTAQATCRCGCAQATKMVGRGSRSSISPPNNGSRDSGRATTKRSKVPFCKEVERLPGVFARLDSSDWRERMSGLEEVSSTRFCFGLFPR